MSLLDCSSEGFAYFEAECAVWGDFFFFVAKVHFLFASLGNFKNSEAGKDYFIALNKSSLDFVKESFYRFS